MLADILVEYGLKIYIFISALRNIPLIHLPNISINGKLKEQEIVKNKFRIILLFIYVVMYVGANLSFYLFCKV